MSEGLTSNAPGSSGRYTPIAELGRGGMATAYLVALQGPGGFNKLGVMKKLRPALSAEPDFIRMFLDEARLAARIDHPSVVHTSEVGFDGSECFIMMEFIDGQPLQNVIRHATATSGDSIEVTPTTAPSAPGGLPLKLSLFVIRQVLEALHFAHELKDFDGRPLEIVHRDVSPQNVMVSYEGHVKLLDFGIAKAADSNSDTRTGVLKGKCSYMAPEQFGGGGIDRRADVFATGTMLWQAVVGRKLWAGLTDVQIFSALAKGEIPRLSGTVLDVDPQLDAICAKALAPDPADRYGSAAEFQSALEDYIAQRPSLTTSSRELAKFMTDLFAEDRQRIQSLIESQLTRAKKDQPTDAELLSLGEFFGSAQARSGVTSLGREPTPSPATRKAPRMIAGVLAAGLAAGGLFWWTQHGVAKRAAAATTDETLRSAAVIVRVQPPEATASLDDRPLSGSPPQGAFKQDNALHRLRVQAPGYVERSDQVMLDSDTVTLDVSLERAAPVAAIATGASPSGPVDEPPTSHANLRSRASRGASPGGPVVPTATAVAPEPPQPAPSPAPTPAPAPSPAQSAAGKQPSLDLSDPWPSKAK